MILSESVKSVSYVKAHASEVLKGVVNSRHPVIVTQNGEAKVIIEDLREYERTHETLALLKLVALGRREVEAGQIKPCSQAFADIDRRISELKEGRG